MCVVVVMLCGDVSVVVADLQELVGAVSELSHRMADSLLHGFATSHAAQIEPGEGNAALSVRTTHP